MRSLLLAAPLLFAFAACGGPPAETTVGEGETPQAEATVTPVDTAVSLANRLGDRLALPDSETRQVPSEQPGADPMLLRLWREGGQPVLLIASEPAGAGRMTAEHRYYFQNGDLFYVREPDVRFVIEDGEIEAWLDDRLRPMEDVPHAERTARAAEVRQRVARYLAAFEA